MSALTDEHIIPFSLNGDSILLSAACTQCQRRSNEAYEQIALNADYLVLRILLQLKRRKPKIPKQLPLVALGNVVSGGGQFNISLDPAEYPPIVSLLVLQPAGFLVGISRGGGLTSVQFRQFNLSQFKVSKQFKQPVTARTPMNHTASSLMLAKIALCFAVAKLGIDGFDGSEIRELLSGKRDDNYNFVGGLLTEKFYPNHHVHALYLRDEGKWLTVIVHLFASLGMSPYQVVVGKRI